MDTLLRMAPDGQARAAQGRPAAVPAADAGAYDAAVADTAATDAVARAGAWLVEQAALNATSVREQLLYDGWLLRFAPGPSKRTRSVNLIGPCALPLPQRLERCRRLYAERGLPLIFRLTSLRDGPELDAQLHELGWPRHGQTRVMARALDADDTAQAPAQAPIDALAETPAAMPATAQIEAAAEAPAATPPGLRIHTLSARAFARALGALRASPAAHVRAHARRLLGLPAGILPLVLEQGPEQGGAPAAAGLAVVDGDVAGLFDIAVRDGLRRQGLGGQVTRALLAGAAARGARLAYLQVETDNDAARRLYASLGFQDIYTYWYRTAPAGGQAGAPAPPPRG